MIEKFRRYYKEKLTVKIVTVIVVVLLAMGIMLPLVLIAELFGVNLRENQWGRSRCRFTKHPFFLSICMLFNICHLGSSKIHPFRKIIRLRISN